MKILADKKAILLRLKNPEMVRAVIPQAKFVQHHGKKYLAVPHQIEVVQVLKNLGIDAPSPISYYYKWPGRFKPYAHQKETASFLTLHNRAFNLNDLGTGKTISTLWAYDYLRSRKVVNKMLVISPLSTLERTWADEIFNNFVHLNVAVLYGSREKRLALLADPTIDIYLINHDGIKLTGFTEALALRPDIDVIAVDEIAQVGRNAGTDRFDALNQICNKQHPRKVWGLTGAPTPNAPTDAWAQCRLIVPEKVPKYFNRFKDRVMRQVTQFVWVPRPDALDVVHEVMQPAIRYHRDECIDLPPCMYETRQCDLTAEQRKAYKAMMDKLVAEVAGGQVTAINEAVKAQKLIQIASGVAYTGEGGRVTLNAKPRMDAVFEIIEQSESKTLVFVPFVGSIAPLREYLEAKGVTTAAVWGDVPKGERDAIFTAFQKERNPRVLVAQPATLSHGLTLTAASTIVWYAPITSADTYVQANARITRPGQKHSQLIIHIEGTELERRYFRRLQDKENTQNVLLDLIKDSREESSIYV